MAGKMALITGATGLLGRQVVKAFEESSWMTKGTGFARANGTSILKIDLGVAAEVERALADVK